MTDTKGSHLCVIFSKPSPMVLWIFLCIFADMNARTINIQEWEPFGGGGYGESYYNKSDDSVILKLNKPSVPAEKTLEEFQLSKAVFDMGIPSARPYEFVTDGERYGMIVEASVVRSRWAE